MTKEQHTYVMALLMISLKTLQTVPDHKTPATIKQLITLGIHPREVTPELILAIEKTA